MVTNRTFVKRLKPLSSGTIPLPFGHRDVLHLQSTKNRWQTPVSRRETWLRRWQATRPFPSVHSKERVGRHIRIESLINPVLPIAQRQQVTIPPSSDSTLTSRWRSVLQIPCRYDNKVEEIPKAFAEEVSVPTWHCNRRNRTPPNYRARGCTMPTRWTVLRVYISMHWWSIPKRGFPRKSNWNDSLDVLATCFISGRCKPRILLLGKALMIRICPWRYFSSFRKRWQISGMSLSSIIFFLLYILIVSPTLHPLHRSLSIVTFHWFVHWTLLGIRILQSAFIQ